MKRSLSKQLSMTILFIVLITVAIISILSNYFINKKFEDYLSKQQELKTHIITSSISNQYSVSKDSWNIDYIHAIGMFSLYEGYIVKVYDKNGNSIWDAQAHDMSLCNQIMNEIVSRMKMKYPQASGEIKTSTYPLTLDGGNIGFITISYYGPFFLNENDFAFLKALNTILLSVGLLSLLVSAIVGSLLAKRISRPILKTVEITKQISAGNYGVRLVEDSNTKELHMLMESINHLAVSLETLERLRKQLTEDVAHELRTPITILQSYLEAMTDGVWDASSDRLSSCYEEVMRIGKLVGDLEKLARIESTNLKLDKQKFELYEVIEKTIKLFQGEHDHKKQEAIIQGNHAELFADKDRISQVVTNLLSNAIKYSGEGSIITFKLFQTQDTVGFHIQDNGEGIPKEDLPYIFERFYRADRSRNRLTGGSGIGLTIVKSIVVAHGGRVSVESNEKEGSRFTVILPKE